jgi:glycosyltransferase involved in cell wall biosynthesis
MLDPQARAIADADVRLLPWLRHPIDPLSDATAVFRLASMLSGVDLLHTHSSKAGIVGRLAARATGVPAVVHTVHGWSFNETQPRGTRRAFIEIERAAARFTDRIVCVSESDRRLGIALGIGDASQYRLVRSGIDPSAYRTGPGTRERMREALGFSPDHVVVGGIANFKPQKGPLDFIEAARRAHEASRHLRFFFAGDGELRGEVERAVTSAGLDGVVRLLGWRSDVAELLSASDLFLLTSLFEGLPRVVLQAMAAGLPVVATDTGGTAEVVRDGITGRLVPPGAPEAAARAVVALAESASLRARMGAAGCRELGAEFDIRKMVTDLEAIYDDLLGRPSATSASHLGLPAARH